MRSAIQLQGLKRRVGDLADAVEAMEGRMADFTKLNAAVDRLIALVEQLAPKTDDSADQSAADAAAAKLDAESDKIEPLVTAPSS